MSSLAVLNNHLFDYVNFQDKSRRAEVESRIWDEFGETGAVCVIDMCDFTSTSQEKGIVYYLSMVRRMQTIVEPIIKEHNGQIVKFDADDCFARFNTVDHAITAIQNIFVAISATNRTTPNNVDIALSVGIDYGRYLLLEKNDYWGEPVNYASKLGEDIADKNMVLLSEAAWKMIEPHSKLKPIIHKHEISGISILSYEVFFGG